MSSELILVSGRSGSGKSVALSALEDLGYHCIDNVPVTLLPELVTELSRQGSNKVAACIDARNSVLALDSYPAIRRLLAEQSVEPKLLFLECSEPVLVQRFSETRRRHPLSTRLQLSLQDALLSEQRLLEPLQDDAKLSLDTSQLSIHQLRRQVKQFAGVNHADMTLNLMSFGYKHGLPLDADTVFDVRCLPNPFWSAPLKHFTGLEQPIIDFLGDKPEVNEMLADIERYCQRWLHHFGEGNRANFTIAIGCTGGHHRSVYLVSQLHKVLQTSWPDIRVFHRELAYD